MRKALLVTALAPLLSIAQSSSAPNILGVWKADMQQSKFAGPPPKQYLELIEEKTVVLDRRTQEKGQEIDELSGVWGEHGEERTLLAFVPNGKPLMRYLQGVPTRITASWQGKKLNLAGEVAGRPVTIQRVYQVSPDGQTITIDATVVFLGHEQHNTIVLTKQPDSEGEPLRKPEETAEAHFKNVKTELMKQLPASQFIDQMRYFAWSLGKDCEFCHVKDHFDSDDKKEKKTAREMIDMTASIDQNNFKGRPEVRCFTCHEFHEHPLSRPLFPDEAAKMQQSAQGQGPDRPMQGQGSGPAGAKPGEMPPGKPQQQ